MNNCEVKRSEKLPGRIKPVIQIILKISVRVVVFMQSLSGSRKVIGRSLKCEIITKVKTVSLI